ncbi:MAG TPA: hypothetical protein VK956_01335, partial [Verrucomicrobium sp.]|nr:hypothetical protein [Verrucomicrobium sp.]
KPQPVPARSERLAPIAKEGASSTLDARHLEISRLADQGDLQEACRKCEALTQQQPLDEGSHFQLGLLLFQLGLWDKAGRALKCCLYLKRDLAIAHYYLGLVQLSLGESALRSFKNAFKLIRRIPDDEVQPWGDGLTAAELRTLIKPYLENGETDGQ